MGETIIFVALINAAMALAFVTLLLALFKWCKVGSGPWYAATLALYGDLLVSLAFNYTWFFTGERPDVGVLLALPVWGG